MKLRTTFNMALLPAFLVCFVAAAWLLYNALFVNARKQVLEEARIMMESANAIRSYTATELDPLLPLDRNGEFVPQTVPAFAAQWNFKLLQSQAPRYAYREPVLNPTNPEDRATDWEADIIQEFRNNPKKTELVSERDTPTGRMLALSRPVTVSDEVCLVCHSTPEIAPAALIRTYGSANGFGWKLGETVGAQIVSVPMATPLAMAWNAYGKFLAVLLVLAVVLAAILNLLLQFLVVAPAKHIARVADAVSLGDESAEEYVKPGNDEMSELSVAFNRMRQSLKLALAMTK